MDFTVISIFNLFSTANDGENRAADNTSVIWWNTDFSFSALYFLLSYYGIFPLGGSPILFFWYKPFIHGCDNAAWK